jgi:hypothetical protein
VIDGISKLPIATVATPEASAKAATT